MNDPLTYGADSGTADLVVYGVHGRGQSPAFIRGLADRIGGLERYRWVMPAAPENTWYPEGFMVQASRNQPHLDQALGLVERDLRHLLKAGTPVVALGFSQGACLLAEHLLARQPPVAGIILHTGGYLGPETRAFDGAAADNGLAATPALVLTADQDPWVPLHRTEETVSALRTCGATVEFRVFRDREHHINEESVELIGALLNRISTRTSHSS